MAIDPNEKFRLRLNGKDELQIRLGPKDKYHIQSGADEVIVPAPESQLRTINKPEDELIVRSNGLINFWDMGQTWDEGSMSWVDLDWSVLTQSANFLLGTYSGGIDNLVAEFDEPTITDYDDLTDLLLTPDPANWRTYYRKLSYEDAEKYGLDLFNADLSGNVFAVGRDNSRFVINTTTPIDGQYWKENGLRLKASDLSNGPTNFTVVGPLAFWDTGHVSSRYKITSSPSYASSAVSFSLLKPTNFFLAPRLASVALTKTYAPDANGVKSSTLVSPYRAVSRKLWLEMTDTDLAYPFFTFDDRILTLDSTNSANIEAHYLADPLSRGFQFIPTSPGTATFDLVEITDSGFDKIVMENVGGGTIGGDHVVVPNVNTASRPAGILAAVAVQGSSRFYFWENTGSDSGAIIRKTAILT